ncbi:MAG: hypothetical protein HZC40_04065 [Chloroflexi bacterium]|nr:hypothetical protein [Chloroflexota bacterium]
MKQYLGRVSENKLLWADAQQISFDAPDLARAMRPGQFALVRDPASFDPYLRRVAWLYALDGARVLFTLSARDPLVARTRVGDELDLLAPFGRAIELDPNARRIVLLGEGARVARLIALAHHASAQGREVVLAHSTRDEMFPAHLLAPEIELRADATDAELLTWADAIVASGSHDYYRALADAVRATRYRSEPGFARVLIEVAMPCGTGACYACALDTVRGIRRPCVDGPLFDLTQLEFAL